MVSGGEGSIDQERIDRRQAMKAALAGAAAAAVWQAPRIEGLTVAPDVAQAATCVSPVPATGTHPASNLGVVPQCWGNRTLTFCGDFTQTIGGLAPFGASIRIGCDDAGLPFTGFGFAQVTINGIDPPWQSCAINLVANCTIGQASGSPLTRTFNTNGTFPTSPPNTQSGTWAFSCNATGVIPAAVTWNITCVCR